VRWILPRRERILRGAFMTRRYTNPRLPLPLSVARHLSHDLAASLLQKIL